ncbi:malate:quinone oxidoreductase [Alkalibacillus almallahensis]|uniref:malate:quinone oxidoreductase n=1 Tax=Alkalibacillus almallahensis TaxID=1379154 RepID=UPI00312C819C
MDMSDEQNNTDVILIGAGIMSATLGTMLKELAPDWNIRVFEQLDKPGDESSNEWNNAGTGHAALCELNYTKEQADGSVDIQKAININEQFQVSKQFWSYLVNRQLLEDPQEFIMPLPHMSMVRGRDNIEFLRKRYEKMSNHPLFDTMEFSEDPEQLKEWFPLILNGRQDQEPMAATKIDGGTDVNFGALTRKLFDHLTDQGVDVQYNQNVDDLTQNADGSWDVKVRHLRSGDIQHHYAKFVFIGAGGGSLHLLQKSGIPESKGIGGFPVSGLFMVCNNPDVIEKHQAKVYGKAPVGAPPMSVPHLDTRYIDGKKTLLFGPFAGFSPRFLKTGALSDLMTSVRPSNMFTMLSAGAKEMGLTKYLVSQVMQSKEQRMETLREFVPEAKSEDWDIVVAGQRVQVIKDTEEGGKGTLQFGTEVVSSSDGTISALLGASPGASTAVNVMLEIMENCFPDYMDEWKPKLQEMIPSYGSELRNDTELIRQVHETTDETLGLSEKPVHQ